MTSILSWLNRQLAPQQFEEAPQDVQQALPPISAPIIRRVNVVLDDDSQQDAAGRGIGEVSFETANESDDEVSAVTTYA